jgi:hypothetical protein
MTSTQRTQRLRARLAEAALTDDAGARTLRLAAVLTEALTAVGVRPILVGGGAVEVYTRAAYMTADLDFVAPSGAATRAVMESLGFVRQGRVWYVAELGIVVEFPSSTLAPARATEIEVDGIEVAIIAIEDLIVDRLAAWKYWRWHPDGVAAGLLLSIHADRIDEKRLQSRSEEEDVADALDAVRDVLRSGDHAQLSAAAMETAHLKMLRRGSAPGRRDEQND